MVLVQASPPTTHNVTRLLGRVRTAVSDLLSDGRMPSVRKYIVYFSKTCIGSRWNRIFMTWLAAVKEKPFDFLFCI